MSKIELQVHLSKVSEDAIMNLFQYFGVVKVSTGVLQLEKLSVATR